MYVYNGDTSWYILWSSDTHRTKFEKHEESLILCNTFLLEKHRTEIIGLDSKKYERYISTLISRCRRNSYIFISSVLKAVIRPPCVYLQAMLFSSSKLISTTVTTVVYINQSNSLIHSSQRQ